MVSVGGWSVVRAGRAVAAWVIQLLTVYLVFSNTMIAGHHDAGFTERVYGHARPNRQAEAVKTMERIFGVNGGQKGGQKG
jgi:hypothetical protein